MRYGFFKSNSLPQIGKLFQTNEDIALLRASKRCERIIYTIQVYKLDFGVPEAIWVINVEDFPAVVTMDAHGHSLHAAVREQSRDVLEKLIG